jgi:hypothetical protein
MKTDGKFRKSTLSAEINCVEVADDGTTVSVRDSKNTDGPTLSFTPGEWDAFIGGAKAGQFDREV